MRLIFWKLFSCDGLVVLFSSSLHSNRRGRRKTIPANNILCCLLYVEIVTTMADSDGVEVDVAKSTNGCTSEDYETRFLLLADYDIEFVVGAEKVVIKGHKAIFCAASDVFHAMFHGDLMETQPVHVEDLQPDGFQGMKKYIYTGQTDFKSVFNALATYNAARKYLIESLKLECIKFINMNMKPSQVLEFLHCCKLYYISEFDNMCGKIINGNAAEVVKSDYFSSANIETVDSILKSPSLKLQSEMEVFSYLERWALAEAERQGISEEDIATSFNSLKKHIRFLTISGEDFVTHIEPSPLLTHEEKHVIAMNKMKFNPNLTSEYISMRRESRHFNNVEMYDQKHMFQISFDVPYGSRTSTSINLLPKISKYHHNGNYSSVTIHWVKLRDTIQIEAEVKIYNSKDICLHLQFQLRFLAEPGYDHKIITNEHTKFGLLQEDKLKPNIFTLELEEIPKSILKAEHYSMVDGKNVINIEGSFRLKIW